MHKNVTFSKTWKCKHDQKCQFNKCAKWYSDENVIKILRLLGEVHFSALKPGPVVPPGTQKVPDQAARISQSVSFGHLSDILGFLGGGRFLTLFLSFFITFNFITFSVFNIFHFVTFWLFWFCWFLSLFHFSWFYSFLCFFTILIYF